MHWASRARTPTDAAKLLRIQAEDKAYISQPSSAEIDSIIHFLEQDRDQKMLSLAYYLAGRVHSDHQETAQALLSYQQSLDLLHPQEELHLHSLIHSQLSSLFLSQQLYDEAMQHILSALRYDEWQHDTTGMIFDLRDIGNIHRSKANNDSCIHYLSRALSLAHHIGDTDMVIDVQSQMAAAYLQTGDIALCRQYIFPALASTDSASIGGIYSIAAEMYRQLGQKDSALFYYRKMEETGNLFSQQEAFKALTTFYLDSGNADEALRYAKRYEEATDSLQEITATETVSRINAMYEHQKQMMENARLREANARKRFVIVGIMATIACLLLLLYALWQKYNYQKTELQLQLKKIKELQQRQATHESKETKYTIDTFHATPIYTRIQQLIDQRNAMNDTDWQQLENAIKQIFPLFMPQLSSVCKLSTQERHVCLLTKADIPPVQIAILTARSKQAINNTRSRLFERTFREKGSPSQWDSFIQTLT
ncbi:MAG: hypothetical protein IJK42_04485 [Prevotella sp.]|nr:hypothetical protein [Prevotella sp.]